MKTKNIILIISLLILASFIARGVVEGMRVVYWVSAFSTGIVIICVTQLIKYLFRKQKIYEIVLFVATYLQFMALLSIFSAFGVMASYGAAWGSSAANNSILKNIDLFFGFNWLAMNNVLIHYPLVTSTLVFFYDSISFLPFLLIALLIADKQTNIAWDFFIFMAIGAAITNTIFYLYPCFGPAVGLNQHNVVANLSYIDSVKAAFNKVGIFTFGLHSLDGANLIKNSKGFYYMTGIVSFPSYHAILAVGVMYFSKYLKPVFFKVLFMFFGAIMIISAIPMGNHYFADILGGLVVSWFAISILYVLNTLKVKSLSKRGVYGFQPEEKG